MNDNTSIAASVAEKLPSPLAFIKRRRWMILFVIFPIVFATIYYGLVASDKYVSESQFAIKSPRQRQAQISTLANLIQTTGLGAGQAENNEVVSYLQSRDALNSLDKKNSYRSRYSNYSIDIFSKFPGVYSTDTFEKLYKYYKKMTNTTIDSNSGLIILKVTAFTAKDSFDLNRALLEQSEIFVNKLNERVRTKTISENERQVSQAELRVRDARIALRKFRNAENLFDPAKQAIGAFDIANRLIAEQSILLAQLEVMERAAPRNPSIPSIRRQISTLGNQIAKQSGRAVGSKSSIASKLGQYESLTAEQDFSVQALTAANIALEQARTEADKQQFYLERVVEPNLPDDALLPNRWWQILSVAGMALCLYFIGWMLIVGILEHAPED
jgi:capsular polysaccharide transport system permease protein